MGPSMQGAEPALLTGLRTPMRQGGRLLLAAARDTSLALDERAMLWVFVLNNSFLLQQVSEERDQTCRWIGEARYQDRWCGVNFSFF
jgi:hypothetical protein